MTNEEWHYEWIKSLVQQGVAVESAEMAFKECYAIDQDLATEPEPSIAAQAYLAGKTSHLALA